MNRKIKTIPVKSERREKKKRPRMVVSGRGAFAIQRIKRKKTAQPPLTV